jgi:SAM-dependent methyltransferase
MADEVIQKSWTGNSGVALLRQSLDFVELVEASWARITDSVLEGKRLLDFGCGYGRIIRLMYYFTSPACIWGLDPWSRSIEICQADGMLGNFAVSDYLPTSLPVDGVLFDFMYALSVFTHLSERAMLQALATLRRYVAKRGVLAITVRPKDYWDTVASTDSYRIDIKRMRQLHEVVGFAFTPHERSPVDGDITYGDTSVTLDWIAQNVPDWQIAGCEVYHPVQVIVYLTPS